jgi:hypothetical protein
MKWQLSKRTLLQWYLSTFSYYGTKENMYSTLEKRTKLLWAEMTVLALPICPSMKGISGNIWKFPNAVYKLFFFFSFFFPFPLLKTHSLCVETSLEVAR